MKGGEDLPSGAIDALVGRSFNLSNARLSTSYYTDHFTVVTGLSLFTEHYSC